MKPDKLSMRLVPRYDNQNKKYYIGRLQFPGNITLENGAVFLVFTSEEGAEELQIAVDDSGGKKSKKKNYQDDYHEDLPEE